MNPSLSRVSDATTAKSSPATARTVLQPQNTADTVLNNHSIQHDHDTPGIKSDMPSLTYFCE